MQACHRIHLSHWICLDPLCRIDGPKRHRRTHERLPELGGRIYLHFHFSDGTVTPNQRIHTQGEYCLLNGRDWIIGHDVSVVLRIESRAKDSSPLCRQLR